MQNVFQEDDDEPDWLASQLDEEDEARPARLSSESDDPFDMLLTPAPLPDTEAPSTSKNPAPAPTRQTDAQDDDDDPLAPLAGCQPPKSAAEAPSGKAATTGKKSSVSIRIPDKLNHQRMLVELPPNADGAADLSGDAGAVGRMSLTTGKNLVLDLKGVVYDITCASLPFTACVVNVTNADAKVEVFCNEFLQLEPSVLFRDSEVLQDGNIDDWMQTDPDNDHSGPRAPPKGKGKGKAAGDLGVSSGKVVKVAARKKAKPAAKGAKPARAKATKKKG